MNINPRDATSQFGRSILKGSFWTSLDKWGTRVIKILIIAILARLLDRKDFGIVALAIVCVDYFSTYVGQGLGLAIIQRKNLEAEHLNAVFWMNLWVAVLLTIILYFSAPYIARLLDIPNAVSVLRWLSLGLILKALAHVQMALINRQMRFESIAKVNLVTSIAGGFAGVTAALSGMSYWSLVIQHLVEDVVNRIALWWVVDWSPKLNFKIRHLRELYRFSAFVFFDQQLLFASRRLDEAIVAGYLGISDLGLYTIAKRVISQLQEAIEAPIAQVLISAFSRIQDFLHEMTEKANRVFSLMAIPFVFSFGSVACLAPEVIQVLFGVGWIDASPLVSVFSSGAIFALFPLIVYPTMIAIGRTDTLFFLNLASSVLGITAVLIGARYGLFGIVIGMVIRQIAMAWVNIFTMWRILPSSRGITDFSVFLKALAVFVPGALAGRIIIDQFGGMAIPLKMGLAISIILFISGVALWNWEKKLFDEIRPILNEIWAARSKT